MKDLIERSRQVELNSILMHHRGTKFGILKWSTNMAISCSGLQTDVCPVGESLNFTIVTRA